MNAKILEHLKGRPIAPIVEASNDIGDVNALKLMCIIDHILQVNGLYSTLKEMPKLMKQLLSLYSFGSFKYYKYNMPKSFIQNQILKCKYCELIGPYGTVVEHMVINHNRHIQTQWCMWCEKTDFKTHKAQSTLDVCYQMYCLKFISNTFLPVIKTYYELLEELAETLSVKIIRNPTYLNSLLAKTHEQLNGIDSSEMSNVVYIYQPKKQSKKSYRADALEGRFVDAMVYFYGPEAYTRFPTFNESSAAYQPSKISRQKFQDRKRRCTSTNTNANGTTESNSSVTPESTPRNDLKEIKSDPDCSPFFNSMATLVNDFQDDRLKEDAKKKIRNIVIRLAKQDLDTTPQ